MKKSYMETKSKDCFNEVVEKELHQHKKTTF